MKITTLACLTLLSAHLARADASCDDRGVARLRQVLPTVDVAMRSVLGARGLAEACARELPRPLAEAMMSMHGVDPSMRGLVAARALAEAPDFAGAACPRFATVFGAVAAAAPAGKWRLLYTQCGYAKLGLMTEAELATLGARDAGMAYLALPLYRFLLDRHMERARARSLMRSICGL